MILEWPMINSIELYDKSESIEVLRQLLSGIKDDYETVLAFEVNE